MQIVWKTIQIVWSLTPQAIEYLEREINETKCGLTSIEQAGYNLTRITEKIFTSSEKIRMRQKSLKFDIKMI
jgi:hypothetical protein